MMIGLIVVFRGVEYDKLNITEFNSGEISQTMLFCDIFMEVIHGSNLPMLFNLHLIHSHHSAVQSMSK